MNKLSFLKPALKSAVKRFIPSFKGRSTTAKLPADTRIPVMTDQGFFVIHTGPEGKVDEKIHVYPMQPEEVKHFQRV
jgi:hypothetical protein